MAFGSTIPVSCLAVWRAPPATPALHRPAPRLSRSARLALQVSTAQSPMRLLRHALQLSLQPSLAARLLCHARQATTALPASARMALEFLAAHSVLRSPARLASLARLARLHWTPPAFPAQLRPTVLESPLERALSRAWLGLQRAPSPLFSPQLLPPPPTSPAPAAQWAPPLRRR